MTNMDKFDLWQYSVLENISDDIRLVRNLNTNMLMIERSCDIESLDTVRAIAEINHKNLMRIYDVTEYNGRCVCLCEYIEGMPLEYAVNGFKPYEEKQAVDIMLAICDGLSQLHSRGIIHRDINPSNVLIDRFGTVKIIDFNISRTVKSGQSKDTQILGTVGYTAPEQFGFSQTTERADVYSCGALLNFLLTGKRPDEKLYEGRLTPIIKQCIEIDEQNRLHSADELKNALLGRKILKSQTFLSEFPRNIPGFRSGKKWQKVLSVIFLIYYPFMLFAFINYTIQFGAQAYSAYQLVYTVVVLGFWSIIPYVCIGDFGNLSRVINRKNPENGRKLLKIIGILSFAVGFVIIMLFGSFSISI